MSWHYLSSAKMTAAVRVEDGTIVRTPPILAKFKGQPFENLVRWMGKQPGFVTQEIRDPASRFVWGRDE